MRVLKIIFSVITVIFGAIGLTGILSFDISLPIMFVFLGATFIVTAKECYSKGAKKGAVIFILITIFIYGVTAFNLISKFV